MLEMFCPRSFGPHRMHEMRTIAIDDLCVCQSVCHAASDGQPAHKWLNELTACLRWRLRGPKIVLDGVPIPTARRKDGVRCGLCQITLATCCPSLSHVLYCRAPFCGMSITVFIPVYRPVEGVNFCQILGQRLQWRNWLPEGQKGVRCVEGMGQWGVEIFWTFPHTRTVMPTKISHQSTNYWGHFPNNFTGRHAQVPPRSLRLWSSPRSPPSCRWLDH